MTELHPWNTSFEWDDHKGPLRVVSEAQAEAFDRDGFFVFADAFDADAVAAILEETDRAEARTEEWLRTQRDERMTIAEAGAITFTTHLVKGSPLLRELTASTPLAAIAADLCGDDVRLYWDQAVYKKPEKPRRFPWHQDNGYAFVEPQQYLTCWIALTDATEHNGCPVVVPGVHRGGTLRHRYVDPLGFECISGDPTDALAVQVTAGSIVVFSSLTPHLTGPNLSDSPRKAWIVQYAPEGAEVLQGDASKGPAAHREPANAEDRQYMVVRGGELVGVVGGAR